MLQTDACPDVLKHDQTLAVFPHFVTQASPQPLPSR